MQKKTQQVITNYITSNNINNNNGIRSGQYDWGCIEKEETG